MPSNPGPTWRFTSDPLSEKIVRTAERALGVAFPADYRECVRLNHGGEPEPADFTVEIGPDRRETRSVGLLLSLDARESENVLQAADELSKDGGLPAGVVPIINDGEGRFVCLDYRRDPERKAPTIVYWSHDPGGEDGVVPVAADFSTFLTLLHA